MTTKLVDAVISSRETHGGRVAVIELVSKSGDKLPGFMAGAHIDVHIDEELMRQYSLCIASGHTGIYRIGVLNDPNSRGGSVKLFDDFVEGKAVTISEPRNHFPVEHSAKQSILVGGGIGITPLISMAYEMRSRGMDFKIHYCVRNRENSGFVEEIEREFGDQLVWNCSVEGPDHRFSPERDLPPPDDGTHIYVCGPNNFMDSIIESAKSLGHASSHVNFEYFHADVDISGQSIEVYCAQSDVTVQVGEEESIAKALKAAGVGVDVSCEEGVCGTCITDVIEGEPDHRDHFLTDEEKEDNDQMALCCSRSKSAKLVIDI